MGRLRQTGDLASNTFWMTGGQAVRLFFQAIYFVLVARALGPTAYGAFVGAVALVAVVAPFSTWGMGFILIKEVARDRDSFAGYWGVALMTTFVLGSILVCAVSLISKLIWTGSIPLLLLILIGVADVVIVRTVDLAAQAFAAVELLRKSAEVYVVLSVARAVSAVYLAFFVPLPSATTWAWLYLASAVVGAIYSIATVSRKIARPAIGISLVRGQLKEGFYFAVSQASLTMHNDIDKTMLVRLGGLDATGLYGAAYRVISVSFTPVSALVYSTLARFFRSGRSGINATVMLAKKLIGYAAVYGAAACILLLLTSPLLGVVLGHDFSNAVVALKWLSPLVLLQSIHYFLANSLSGAGHQGIRTIVQLSIVVFNVLLNLWLIPLYSWRGAAWASLASDAMLVIMFCLVVKMLQRRTGLTQRVPAFQPEALP